MHINRNLFNQEAKSTEKNWLKNKILPWIVFAQKNKQSLEDSTVVVEEWVKCILNSEKK